MAYYNMAEYSLAQHKITHKDLTYWFQGPISRGIPETLFCRILVFYVPYTMYYLQYIIYHIPYTMVCRILMVFCGSLGPCAPPNYGLVGSLSLPSPTLTRELLVDPII